jgi:hypothetical protein
MRPFLLLLLIACAPVEPDASLPASQAAAPTPGFTLAAPVSVMPGGSLPMTATLPSGAPNTQVRFVLGRGGVGPGPCFFDGCLDVAGPLIVLGTDAPSGGVASLTRTIPSTVPWGSYALQAAQVTPSGTLLLSNPRPFVVGPPCGDGVLVPGEACLADTLIEAMRNDLVGTMLAASFNYGWPVPVEGGLLFATYTPGNWSVAGDHSGWAPQPMQAESGFRWTIREAAAPGGYKFTTGSNWMADGWSRQYTYDSFGELSLHGATGARLERLFGIGGGPVSTRTIRAWIPAEPVTHLLYAHDGQNLFDPGAIWGGWNLQGSAPPGMMIVGVDNSADRFDEYTHVVDNIGSGPVGGDGNAYATFMELSVRPAVQAIWGEPDRVGVMGSSLGGLIALHQADRYPGRYDFAASLSGTIGWGSIGMNNPTIMQRYVTAGLRDTVLYLDSGGGGSCYDADADGINDDDPTSSDNYCTTAQMRDALYGVGYTPNVDLYHWWEPGQGHNEAAWASRVWRPMQIFAGM